MTGISAALACGKPGCPCAATAKRGTGVTHCPAHNDRTPSLSLYAGRSAVLWDCKAGCDHDAVTEALRARGLLHPIRDRAGDLVAYHERKGRWFKPNLTPGLNGVGTKDMLYGLERLTKDRDTAVIVVEGEKATDALQDQVAARAVVLGTVCGAAATPSDWVLDELRDRRVFLWPDNDEEGRQHMARIATRLHHLKAKEVLVVEWPEAPDKGDAADYCATHKPEDVYALLREAHGLEPADTTSPLSDEGPDEKDDPGIERFGRALLHDLWADGRCGGLDGPDFHVQGWVVRKQITLFVGTDKLGKTTQSMRRAVTRATAGDRVLVVTEMDEEGFRQLLQDDNIEPPPPEHFRVLFLADSERGERLQALTDACRGWKPDYVILDPLDEALGFDGDQIKNPEDVAGAFLSLRALVVTIEGLYHPNKAGQVANSYKFTAKADHYYLLTGDDPSNVIYRYKGRSRLIPKARRITGNGWEGYHVTELEAAPRQPGRPAESSARVLDALPVDGAELSLEQVAAKLAPMSTAAVTMALERLHLKRLVERPRKGWWRRTNENLPGISLDPSPKDKNDLEITNETPPIPSQGISLVEGNGAPADKKSDELTELNEREGDGFRAFVPPVVPCPVCGWPLPDGGRGPCANPSHRTKETTT